MSASDYSVSLQDQACRAVRFPTKRALLIALIVIPLLLDAGYSRYQGRPDFSVIFSTVTAAYANTIGLLRWRDGYLTNQVDLHQTLVQTLQPFDILVLAAPFKATALTTPGRFSHVAIWLGTEKDWRARKWDQHPRYRALFKEVAAGRSMLQSDRLGVHMEALSISLNADEIAIYRSKALSAPDFYFDRVIANMGKAYDYNLDGHNQQSMICTELVSALFPDLSFDMTHLMGRDFIIPDQIIKGLEQAAHWQNWFHAKPSP